MIALIAAFSQGRVMGAGGHLPWTLDGELQRFRTLTTGHVVVMGRRTYEDIGHPLPGRLNIVLSRTQRFEAPNCVTAGSLVQALQLAEKLAPGKTVYISGGAELYRQALPLADVLYITHVHCNVPGDTFFPPFAEEDYEKEVQPTCEKAIPYTYLTYTRR